MNRKDLGKNKFNELTGGYTSPNHKNNPELTEILQDFIFGEIFFTGNLSDQMRELITITVLTTNNTLDQLTSHVNIALNIGVSPIEIQEAIYQCAPFIGFPKTLSAINKANEVFISKNISLPLDSQKNVEEELRFIMGTEIQYPLYGNTIKTRMMDLPDEFAKSLPKFLTEVCFGDFSTRSGLDTKTRELLILCSLITLGDTTNQIISHSKGCIKAGNDINSIYSAVIHCIPYIGFPRVINAINIIKENLN